MHIVDDKFKEEFNATNSNGGIEFASDQISDDHGGKGGRNAPTDGLEKASSAGFHSC